MIANPHVGCQEMTLKIQQYMFTRAIQSFPKLGHKNQYCNGQAMAIMAVMLILAAWRLAVDGVSLRKLGSRLREIKLSTALGAEHGNLRFNASAVDMDVLSNNQSTALVVTWPSGGKNGRSRLDPWPHKVEYYRSTLNDRRKRIRVFRWRAEASQQQSLACKRMARPGLLIRIPVDRKNRRDEAVDRPTAQSQSLPSRFATGRSRRILSQSPPIHRRTVSTQSHLHGTLSNHAARPCRIVSQSRKKPQYHKTHLNFQPATVVSPPHLQLSISLTRRL